METTYLRTLIEAVEIGSISEAAERLFVTPSAASRRIKFLEDFYGTPLLDRSGPVLKPTEAGRLVLEKAAMILSIEKDIAAALRGVADKQCVSFCCTPAFGIAFLPAIMKNYMMGDSKSEDLNIMVGTPDDVARRLKERSADIAVVEQGGMFPVKGYEEFPLPDEELVFVSAPGTGIDPDAEELSDFLPYRLFTRVAECGTSICLNENMKRLGTDTSRFKGVAKMDDLHLIIRAVEDGAGVAYLSRYVVEAQLEDGRLRGHHINGFMHRFRRNLVVKEGFRSNCRCASFAKAVLSVFDLEAAAGI